MGSRQTSNICDSCKTTPATVFCRADSAFLCVRCDAEVHAANKLVSRHARVWVCEVCEQAPAVVTCKADAAALCAACDGDIHSANPLARRHQRLPIIPFHGAASATKSSTSSASAAIGDDFSEEEAEAASWLLTNPNVKLNEGSEWPGYKSLEHLFSDSDPFFDLDLIPDEKRPKHVVVDEQQEYSFDGVVPVQIKNEIESGQIVNGFPTCDVNFPMYNFSSQSMSQSVSSSSLEIVVVPDHNSAMADATNDSAPIRISGIDREARVLRYREKRKSRKFEKTIRYASRKAYAETRPRIKGRFAKRSELDVDSYIAYDDASFCIVPLSDLDLVY